MLFTGSFFTFDGPGRVSIARSAPRGQRGYTVMRALAPAFRGWNNLPKAEYQAQYFKQLDALNMDRIILDLQEKPGPHAVLCCWENPPFDEDKNWCHRRMLASWVHNAFGLVIPEYAPAIHKAKIEEDWNVWEVEQLPVRTSLDLDRRVGLIEGCRLTGLKTSEIYDARVQNGLKVAGGKYRLGDLVKIKDFLS